MAMDGGNDLNLMIHFLTLMDDEEAAWKFLTMLSNNNSSSLSKHMQLSCASMFLDRLRFEAGFALKEADHEKISEWQDRLKTEIEKLIHD